MLVFCSAACWSQQPQTPQPVQSGQPAKPCVDLTLHPAEPDAHKILGGVTETADRMLGVLPSQMVDSTEKVCPLTNSEKLHVYLRDSYSPFNVLSAAFNAAIYQATDGRSGYGQGWDAYGSRFGAAFADGETSGFFQAFLIPSLLHQDPRFFRMRDGPVVRRGLYAMTRVFITHNDSGRHQFNYSEVVGGFAAAGISNLYYPSDRRDAGDVLYRAGMGIVSDAGWNLLKEFGPDLSRAIFHRHDSKKPDSNKTPDSKKKDAGAYGNVPRP